MTNWRTRTDIDWADERTVIDPRSVDVGKPHDTEQRVPHRAAARFKQHLRPRLLSFSPYRHRTTLAFAGLGVALVLAIGFAVREHVEANALREALRIAEISRASVGSGVVDSVQPAVPRDSLPDPRPTVSLTAGDRARAEREATDFVVAHNYEAALSQFELLRNAFPEHRVYSDLIDVLRWELGCGRGEAAQGRQCK